MEENKDTKICPYCGEKILKTAKKCKFCKEWINQPNSEKFFLQERKNISKNIYIAVICGVLFIVFMFCCLLNTELGDFQYASITSTKNLNPENCTLTHKEIIEILNQQYKDCQEYVRNKENPIEYREKLFTTYYRNIQYYVKAYNHNFRLKDSDFHFLKYGYFHRPVYMAYKDGIQYVKEYKEHYSIYAPSTIGLDIKKNGNDLKIVFDERILPSNLFFSKNWYNFIYVKDLVNNDYKEKGAIYDENWHEKTKTSKRLLFMLNEITSDFALQKEKNELLTEVTKTLLINSETFDVNNQTLTPISRQNIEQVLASVNSNQDVYIKINQCYSILQSNSYQNSQKYKNCVANIKY